MMYYKKVSDHGMTEVSDKKVIYYDEIVSPALLQHVQSREAFPLLDLRPNPNAPKNTTQALYHQLVNYTQSVSDPHFQVYLRDQVPARFHYSNSERITPVVAIPDPGYTFATREEILKYGFKQGGNHGYDNLAEEMRAIFIASGPKVQHYYRPGTILVPFFNIEVYRFLSDLLNIDAAPNNGTMEGDFPPIYIPPF
jgi:predicted AlkP superfamily pyrophosphatase or phosphodiesterase